MSHSTLRAVVRWVGRSGSGALVSAALVVGACWVGALGVSSVAYAAGETSAKAGKAFKSSDVFTKAHHMQGSNEASWSASAQWLDKPAPRLQVGSIVAMSDGLPARPINELKGQVLVLDFWATWCGPCLAGMKKNSELAKKFAEKGVSFVGVCSPRGGNTMQPAGEKAGMEFPTALDTEGMTAAAYGVRFYPTYVIVDREGVIRAHAVSPNAIETVLNNILEYQPAATGGGTGGESGGEPGGGGEGGKPGEAPKPAGGERVFTVDASWLEGTAKERERLVGLEGAAAPALSVENWLNAEEAIELGSLRGKVVLVDFWATWCGPCKESIPALNSMHERYADQGLVVIGVCAQRGHQDMASVASSHGIKYPVAADTVGKTTRDYKVNGYPDFYLIDRSGVVRVADITNGKLEEAVKALLEEGR